jgi:cytochrome c peroxidase
MHVARSNLLFSAVLSLAMLGGLTSGCSVSAENEETENVEATSDPLSLVGISSAFGFLDLRNDAATNQRVIKGLVQFFAPFPGGNGRACATCHRPEDGFGLKPSTVEKVFRRNPNDPLFRSIDADDHAQDFTTLRTKALIRVGIKLPSNVKLTSDPTATQVDFFRAVPSIWNVATTAPYQMDGRIANLEDQALAALQGHMEIVGNPNPDFLRNVAEFQAHFFTSRSAADLARGLASGSSELPDTDGNLSAVEQQGKVVAQKFCLPCHGGPTQTVSTPGSALFFPPFTGAPGTVIPKFGNAVVSGPPPSWFPLPVITHDPSRAMPTRNFTVTNPDGTTQVRESSDPGRLLISGTPSDFNRFDVPPLRGISKTAPYFHDNRAHTIEEVVDHYQALFSGFKNPPINSTLVKAMPDADVAPLIAYLKKI